MCMWVQLRLSGVQTMQDISVFELHDNPPQTISLPPDRSERLWRVLPSGRSGMEQVLEGGGGNISTEERGETSFIPLTITCPVAKLIKDEAIKRKHFDK